MSNPLFASHMMQMAYLCKKQPPAELLLCVPCNGSLTDISRYKRSLSITGSPTYGTDSLGPYAANFQILFSDFNPELDFTVETMFYYMEWTGSGIGLGGNSWKYNTWATTYYLFDTPSGSTPNQSCAEGWRHIAFVKRDTNMFMYHNGILIATKPYTTIDASITVGYNTDRYRNVRIVQKALGTTSSFPVPSTLYTGYEAL